MKERVKRHLLHGVARHSLPPEAHAEPSTRPWRPLRERTFPYSRRGELDRLERAPLTTLELRHRVACEVSRIRRCLARNQRAGLQAKRGARLLRRLRHFLDTLPDPHALPAEALRPYAEDASPSPEVIRRWRRWNQEAA